MGSFLIGSLRKVLANLRCKGKSLEITGANYPCRNYPLTSARILLCKNKLHNRQINSKTILWCNPMSTRYALQQGKKLHNRENNSRPILQWKTVNLAPMVCGWNQFLGPVHGRTDFSRIFIFEPPDFFADFLAGFFLLIFVGKSAQKNPPRKSPGKSSKIYTTKIPDTFLQRGRANNLKVF